MSAPGAGDALRDAAGVSIPEALELFRPPRIFQIRTFLAMSMLISCFAFFSHSWNKVSLLASILTGRKSLSFCVWGVDMAGTLRREKIGGYNSYSQAVSSPALVLWA